MSTQNVERKAVRDKIPQIIEEDGRNPSVGRVSDSEFLEYLEVKLIEELEEYGEDKDVEELVDLVEVCYAIAARRGLDETLFHQLREKKQKEKGAFRNNWVLEFNVSKSVGKNV